MQVTNLVLSPGLGAGQGKDPGKEVVQVPIVLFLLHANIAIFFLFFWLQRVIWNFFWHFLFGNFFTRE